MKTNERLTGTETDLYYRAEKAIFNYVGHKCDLYVIEGLTPYMTGYILNYGCNKTGKHFLVRVWGDSSEPLVFVND